MMTTNILEPKVYQTTKIVELNPLGIIKLSLKQDEYNEKRDNIELMICDYYTDNGDTRVGAPEFVEPDNPVRDTSTSFITRVDVNTNGEYVPMESQLEYKLKIGQSSYFKAEFSQLEVDPEWDIQLVDTEKQYSAYEVAYWEGLVKLTKFTNGLLSVKPGKAHTLKGQQFILSVSDFKGDYYSSVLLEVTE